MAQLTTNGHDRTDEPAFAERPADPAQLRLDVRARKICARPGRLSALPLRFAALTLLALLPSAVLPQESPPPSNTTPADAQKTKPFGRRPPPQLPFGLSCSQCMIAANSSCADLSKTELVLDVRDMQPIDERKRCAAEEPLEGISVTTCSVAAAAHFGGVMVLRSPYPAVSTKIFLTQYTVEGTPPIHTGGVRLLPDTRYLLFTKRATWNAPFGAQWYVVGACQIPKSERLNKTND